MTSARLRLDPADSRPLWRQIEEGVARLVAGGALAAGAAVPSVRELAIELRVNPATVSKAYQRLVDRGLLETRRGEGTFVTEEPPRLSESELHDRLLEAARPLATAASTLGTDLEAARDALERAWLELRPEKDDPR